MFSKIKRKLQHEASYKTGEYKCAPDFLSLIMTFQCNFCCKSCSIWQKKLDFEMDENDWVRVLPNISKVFNKNTFVEINGGEPLLREDIVFLLIKNLKKHFDSVTLNSNGSLINPELIEKLEEVGLDKIKISLYSNNKDTHNLIRGNQIAYDGAINAIYLLQKSKIKLEVGILITSQNINEIPELIDYLEKLENVTIILQVLDEKVESAESKNKDIFGILTELWPEENDVKNLFEWLEENKEKIKRLHPYTNLEVIKRYYLSPKSILKYRCMVGQRNCIIYPNGDVTFCFNGSMIGNIKDQNLSDILKSMRAKNERISVQHCQKICRAVGCNFSRGLKEIAREKLNIKR